MNQDREKILTRIRTALGGSDRTPASPLPQNVRVAPRIAGKVDAEVDLLLAEIGKLGGITRRIAGLEELQRALCDLVRDESVKKATLWQTSELQELGIERVLISSGVEIVPSDGDKRALAECDLGVTGADAALPETGTLVLRASGEHPQMVSLLPRVHLAIVRPNALRADLHEVLDEVKGDKRVHFVTGPSRTADIEKTLTIGVHGPKALYVWVYA
ncbi:MAG TPA: LUD domain-containing protein [Anaerolineae bacterium]